MHARCLLGLATLLLCSFVLPTTSTKAAESNVEKKIAAFSLKNVDGKDWAMKDVTGKKAFVVIFMGTECPINNAYIPRLVEMSKSFPDVQFVGVNANSQDSAKEIAAHAKQFGIPFPVLKDENNTIADQFQAERTPECFLLDAKLTVRYRGRIDDQHGIGFKRPLPTRRDLQLAVEQLLADKPIEEAVTTVTGCCIARVVKTTEDSPITFTKHVSRIVQKHCQECHRPGQVGPMSLLDYDDVKAWSATIKEVVEEKRMPPWHADPKFGKFANDRSLSKEDRETLLSWVEKGCPKGDDKDLPFKKEFTDTWTIGKPDAIFAMKDDFTVPAKAPGQGIRYQYFTIDPKFDEDKWIQAAECKPGNRAVVHHIIVYVKPPTGTGNREDGIGNGFLVAYAPGDMPLVLDAGSAKKIPKGSILVFQMHYTPTGTEEKDKSSVALKFAKDPPKNEVRTRAIAQHLLSIPAGAGNYKTTSVSTFREEAVLLALMPHMHLRGKSFEYRVTFPDGKEEVLLSVPRYDFSWQSSYRLEKPLQLPAGSRIHCTAHFDNSKDNPNNPDPGKTVRWGEQTWEEMMIGFVDYAFTKSEK